MLRKKISHISLLIIVAVFFTSCDFLSLQKKEIKNLVIATFDNQSLYLDDIRELIPKSLSKNDSVLVVKQLIDSWALQQALLKKSEENNTQVINEEIKSLVEEYRKSLLINRYKEDLIQQELDTVVTESDIQDYYDVNKSNFRLSEELIQIRYLTFNNNLINKKDILRSFKNGTIQDLEDLESQQLSFKKMMLNDSSWVSLNNVLKETVFYRDELLKKSEFIQKEDSINLFLAVVTNVLNKNEISPLEYIKGNIKQILLHKRKLEVIREIEKILLKDAIKNKQLVYK